MSSPFWKALAGLRSAKPRATWYIARKPNQIATCRPRSDQPRGKRRPTATTADIADDCTRRCGGGQTPGQLVALHLSKNGVEVGRGPFGGPRRPARRCVSVHPGGYRCGSAVLRALVY